QTAARITATTRERIIDEARKTFMPEAEESAETEAKNLRAVDIHTHAPEHGVVGVHAALDLPVALALEAAITAGAQALADAGSDAPVNTRRSWALGDLARAASGHGTLHSPTVDPVLDACVCACHEQHPPML